MIRVRMGDRFFEVDRKRIRLEALLRDLCINPEDVVVVKGERPITEDAWLEDGDEITVYEVVSRG